MTNLANAIEHLYQTFSAVEHPHGIDGCPCCTDPDEIGRLLRTPLRSIKPDDMGSYAASLFNTVGEVADFRYFLPRIFELMATDPFWWPDPEIVLEDLKRAGWRGWDQAEIDAILQMVDAAFRALLESEEETGGRIDSMICGIARGEIDLEPFLSLLEEPRFRSKLVEYYEVNSERLIRGKLSNPFWKEAPQGKERVVEWFRSPKVHAAIMAGYGL